MNTPPKQHANGFQTLVNDAKTRVREIDVAEYQSLKAGANAPTLVDVREESEWAGGHADGAIHLGKGVIERDIEKTVPNPETPLVLYCGGGFRSALAGDALQKMGYRNVLSLAGGWRAWNEAGLPVKKG